jgi:MFS family permease
MKLGLSRELWLVQGGIFLNMLGYGAVLPFEIIYLHDGRGFSVGVAGLVVGVLSWGAVAAAPAAGPLIDRYGARATAGGAGIALAAGYAGLAFAHRPGPALAAAACAGAGNGALNPSQSALLATLADAGRPAAGAVTGRGLRRRGRRGGGRRRLGPRARTQAPGRGRADPPPVTVVT